MGKKEQIKTSEKTVKVTKEYKTMEELEKEFFPQSFKKQLLEGITDPHALGAALAQESLDIIRARLAGK
jgi:hypothetical protein